MKRICMLALLSAPFISFSQSNDSGTMAPDTVIIKETSYTNAEYWIIHTAQGKVKAQGRMVNHKKEGLWREYNEGSGIPTKAEEYHNGEKDGASMTYGTGGNIISDETYMNGKKEGQQMTFSSSWRIQGVENYHDGLLDGSRKLYYDDGKLKEESFWKNGQRSGKTTWYFQNGKPSIEYTYKNGDLNGHAATYSSENGFLVSEGNFLNNDENGKWDFYAADGKLEKSVIYEKGKAVKEIPAPKDVPVKKK